MDSATLIRDIAAIFLMAAGTVLCVTLTIGLFKIFPCIPPVRPEHRKSLWKRLRSIPGYRGSESEP